MAADRLSPVNANHPLDRARWLNQSPVYLAHGRTALLVLLGLDEDGWRTDERQRFLAWGLSGHDVSAARTLLARAHGPAYVRHLIETGRVGEGVPL